MGELNLILLMANSTPQLKASGQSMITCLDSAALQPAPGPQWALGGVSPF